MEAVFQFKPEILEESVHGRPALYPFRFAMGVCSSRVHVFCGLKKTKKAYSFVRPWSFKDEWCRTAGYRGRCHVPFSSWLSKVGALSLFTAQSQTHSQWVLELRQGCPLSPSLFLTFMDRISRHRQREERVQFENHTVFLLLHIITWQSFTARPQELGAFFVCVWLKWVSSIMWLNTTGSTKGCWRSVASKPATWDVSDIWLGCLQGFFHWEVFQAHPTGKILGGDPEVTAGTVCHVGLDASGSPKWSWWALLWRSGRKCKPL